VHQCSSTVVFLEVVICPADLIFVVVVDVTSISTNPVDLSSRGSCIKGEAIFIKAWL